MRNAGSSAQREYDRRLAKQRARTPLLLALAGGAAVGMFAGGAFEHVGHGLGLPFGFLFGLGTAAKLGMPKSSTLSWRTGAAGERKTAQKLASLEPSGFIALHDRKIRGATANIDHVVVGPSGLFVIETKHYSGRLQVRNGEIFVNGRRRTAIVDQALKEHDAVRRALGIDLDRTRAPLIPLICVHHAELPWGKIALKGVRVVAPREMVDLIQSSPFVLHPDEVDRLARILDERLHPA